MAHDTPLSQMPPAPADPALATALDVPFHSALDPAAYNYQLFGYFLLLDDAWEYHRQAIGLDVWRR